MSKRLKDYNSALKFGAKIYPEDLAGMVGLPFVSNVYYVDPSGGNDSNPGTSSDNQKKTIGTASTGALATMTANQHDVTIINPTGGTGRTSESTAITWNKRFTHLVGNAAPVAQDNRAGIGFATGGSLTISENGCLFKTLTMFSSADIDETVSVTGSYNSFLGVDFKGTSNATSIASTPWRALNLNGGQENYFGGCTIGADTYARSTTNATLEFESAASRNVFENCRFLMHASNVGVNHVLLTGANAIDRWIEFRDCFFYTFWTNDADKITHVIDAEAQTATAHINLTGNTTMEGADNWEAVDSGKVYAYNYTPTANIIGKMVTVDVV